MLLTVWVFSKSRSYLISLDEMREHQNSWGFVVIPFFSFLFSFRKIGLKTWKDPAHAYPAFPMIHSSRVQSKTIDRTLTHHSLFYVPEVTLALLLIEMPRQLCMKGHASNPSTQGVEAGGSKFEAIHRLHRMNFQREKKLQEVLNLLSLSLFNSWWPLYFVISVIVCRAETQCNACLLACSRPWFGTYFLAPNPLKRLIQIKLHHNAFSLWGLAFRTQNKHLSVHPPYFTINSLFLCEHCSRTWANYFHLTVHSLNWVLSIFSLL